mmetsp:Transcript_29302/g.95627  ORF Transcript_29302/g.95627 Transcript_29302/m.95627 type:complete len:736 (-) Transcript_29302:305-2512(-)
MRAQCPQTLPPAEVTRQCREHHRRSHVPALHRVPVQLRRLHRPTARGQHRKPVRLAAHQHHQVRQVGRPQRERQTRRQPLLGRRRVPHVQQRGHAVARLRAAQHHARLAHQTLARRHKVLQRSRHARAQRLRPQHGEVLSAQALLRVPQHGARSRRRVHDGAKVRARVPAHRDHRREVVPAAHQPRALRRHHRPQAQILQQQRRAASLHLLQAVRAVHKLRRARRIVVQVRQEARIGAQQRHAVRVEPHHGRVQCSHALHHVTQLRARHQQPPVVRHRLQQRLPQRRLPLVRRLVQRVHLAPALLELQPVRRRHGLHSAAPRGRAASQARLHGAQHVRASAPAAAAAAVPAGAVVVNVLLPRVQREPHVRRAAQLRRARQHRDLHELRVVELAVELRHGHPRGGVPRVLPDHAAEGRLRLTQQPGRATQLRIALQGAVRPRAAAAARVGGAERTLHLVRGHNGGGGRGSRRHPAQLVQRRQLRARKHGQLVQARHRPGAHVPDGAQLDHGLVHQRLEPRAAHHDAHRERQHPPADHAHAVVGGRVAAVREQAQARDPGERARGARLRVVDGLAVEGTAQQEDGRPEDAKDGEQHAHRPPTGGAGVTRVGQSRQRGARSNQHERVAPRAPRVQRRAPQRRLRERNRHRSRNQAETQQRSQRAERESQVQSRPAPGAGVQPRVLGAAGRRGAATGQRAGQEGHGRDEQDGRGQVSVASQVVDQQRGRRAIGGTSPPH